MFLLLLHHLTPVVIFVWTGGAVGVPKSEPFCLLFQHISMFAVLQPFGIFLVLEPL